MARTTQAVAFDPSERLRSGLRLTSATRRAQLKQMTLLPPGSVTIEQQSPQTMP
jgi:hypothetical protein